MTCQFKLRVKQAFRHIAAGVLLLPVLGYAQTAVTNWVLSNANAANTTGYTPTVTFDNQTNTVTSITVGGMVRTVSSNADDVFVRRAGTAASTGTTAGSANVWEVATTSTSLLGTNTSANTLQNCTP